MTDEALNPTSDGDIGDAIMDQLIPEQAAETEPEVPEQEVAAQQTEETPPEPAQEEAQEQTEEAAKEATEEPTEEQVIASIEELAEAQGWDTEDLYGLNVQIEEGQEPLPLKTIVEHYQQVAQNKEILQQNIEAYNEFNTQQKSYLDNFQRDSAVASQLLDTMEANLDGLLETPEMMAMKQSDQGAYAQEVLKIREHKEVLQTQRNELAQHYQQTIQQATQQTLQAEAQKLQKAWGDQVTDNYGVAVDTLRSLGLTNEEINSVVDARFVRAAHELGTLRQLVSQGKAKDTATQKAKKKLSSLPKKVSFRAGSGRAKNAGVKGDTNVVKFSNKASEFVKSGGTDEKAFEDALDAMLS